MSDDEDMKNVVSLDEVDSDHEEERKDTAPKHARVSYPMRDEEDEEEEEEDRDDDRRENRERRGRGGRRLKEEWKTEKEYKKDEEERRNEQKVSKEAIDELYRELKFDPSNRREGTIVILKGCDKMTRPAIQQIFGDFRVIRTVKTEDDDTTAFVFFSSRSEAAAMMILQTKRLRRVRSKKAPEEGELREDSEEEEGELLQEDGDDVAVEDTSGSKVIKDDYVEVNLDMVALPEGKWRVLSKHVPDMKLILIRFATIEELKESRSKLSIHDRVEREEGGRKRRMERFEADEFPYVWMEKKARPGLNLFDSKGEELEWDYEHDTRFYEDLDTSKDEESKDEEAMAAWPVGDVKIRGRGAKSARFCGGTSSLRADEKKETTFKIPAPSRLTNRVRGGVFEDDGEANEEDVEEDEGNPEPTPQSWNRSSRMRDRITFDD